MKIAEDQEVLVASASNFAGYYEDAEATKKAYQDGWLHTGDAGYVDKDGHLHDRPERGDHATEEGEAFSPDFIETRLKFSPYVKEAVVFGEGRRYITASSTSTWATWEAGPRTA